MELTSWKLPIGTYIMKLLHGTTTMEVTSSNLHHRYLMARTPWKVLHGMYTIEDTSWNLHHRSYLVERTPWKLTHGTYIIEGT